MFEGLLHGKNRGLGVQGIKHRLDHDEIGAALDEPQRGVKISGTEFIKGDIAKPRIVDVRRQRGRAVGRAEDAGHQAGPRRRRMGIADLAGKTGAFAVEFAHHILQSVIGLADARGVEGIGLQYVDAGFQIGSADIFNDVRTGQRQKVVVALEVMAVVGKAAATKILFGKLVTLDHHAPGAVQHKDTLLRLSFYPRDAISAVHVRSFSGSVLLTPRPRMRQAA